MSSFIRRWTGAAGVAVAAGVAAVVTVIGDNVVFGIVLTVVLLAVAWLASPLLYPRSPDWTAAQELARTRGVPLILCKPGCAYCIRLRLTLGLTGSRAIWVDIWADEDAAAATRELNGGDETTPTVIIADAAHTNPEPTVVRGCHRRTHRGVSFPALQGTDQGGPGASHQVDTEGVPGAGAG